MRRNAWFSLLCTLMALLGCSGAQDDLSSDAESASSGLAVYENADGISLHDDALPGEDVSDVAVGLNARGQQPATPQRPQAASANTATAAGSLASETLTSTRYTGPPILLDEPSLPPPAQIVARDVSVETYEDGSKHIERGLVKFSDNRVENDGPYREYFRDGKLFVEGAFREGIRIGQWTYWHPSGQKNRTVSYEGGLAEGSWDVFRADGTLAERREFKRGQRDGTWIAYDESGTNPRIEQQYRGGKSEGTRKEWYASGQLKSVFTFADGQRHGPASEWNESGKKLAEVNYARGQFDGRATVWTADGKETVRVYDNGKLVSGPAGDPALGGDGQ